MPTEAIPAPPPPSEEGINIVLEDELIITDRVPTATRLGIPSVASHPSSEEDSTQVKPSPRDRFSSRPFGPTKR